MSETNLELLLPHLPHLAHLTKQLPSPSSSPPQQPRAFLIRDRHLCKLEFLQKCRDSIHPYLLERVDEMRSLKSSAAAAAASVSSSSITSSKSQFSSSTTSKKRNPHQQQQHKDEGAAADSLVHDLQATHVKKDALGASRMNKLLIFFPSSLSRRSKTIYTTSSPTCPRNYAKA